MIHFIGDGGHAKVCKRVEKEMEKERGECEDRSFVAIGDNAKRKQVALDHTGPFGVLIHPATTVENATIGGGTVIMAHAVIQPHVTIGRHVIINTGATVDHHCIIEDYAHIAPGAHLCGNVHVGEGALVGVGVGIEPGVQIPAWSVVKRSPYEITLRGN